MPSQDAADSERSGDRRLSTCSPFAVCWTNNMRGAANDELYIMHAVLKGSKTLCGCQIQEVGENVDDEHRVGCKRCLRIMENETSAGTDAGEKTL